MKKTFLFFVFIFLLLWFLMNKKTPIPVYKTETTPIPIITVINPTNTTTVDFENNKYQIFYSKISGKTIELIPNFSQKKLAQDIVAQNSCKVAINGGYYTEEGRPLGLFISGGNSYSDDVSNSPLLTGYFYLDQSGNPIIDSTYNRQSSLIMQTGPFIINDKKLTTQIDEETRRSLLVQDIQGDLYAVAITKNDSFYSGPTLSNLPPILFSIETPFKVVKGLNLDGGSASVYFGEDGFKLTELSNIGSLLCAK